MKNMQNIHKYICNDTLCNNKTFSSYASWHKHASRAGHCLTKQSGSRKRIRNLTGNKPLNATCFQKNAIFCYLFLQSIGAMSCSSNPYTTTEYQVYFLWFFIVFCCFYHYFALVMVHIRKFALQKSYLLRYAYIRYTHQHLQACDHSLAFLKYEANNYRVRSFKSLQSDF